MWKIAGHYRPRARVALRPAHGPEGYRGRGFLLHEALQKITCPLLCYRQRILVHMKYCSILSITIAATLSACVSTDLSWKPIPGAGPYTINGASAPAYQKCEQHLMDGARQCNIAFEDATGQKIEVFHTLIPALDAYLQTIPEYESWPKSAGTPVEVRVPYKLYLLTISPAIVVMVPSPPASLVSCWMDAPAGTCLRSYAAQGNSYDLSTEIPVVKGSRWFALGSTNGAPPIPTENATFDFPLKGVTARLVKAGTSWKFERAQ